LVYWTEFYGLISTIKGGKVTLLSKGVYRLWLTLR